MLGICIMRGSAADSAISPREFFMLHYALVFLVIAIIAGVLGFWRHRVAHPWHRQSAVPGLYCVLFVLSLLLGQTRADSSCVRRPAGAGA
jgi:uncharacterized membrane protein YtjA (UPF0391 family)